MDLKTIEEKAKKNKKITSQEAMAILESSDESLMDVVASAKRVRETFFGKYVKLNYLVNVKSGLCPEDCHYCSQSKDSKAPIDKYSLMPTEKIMAHVEKALASGAVRACLVGSGRGPGSKELNQFCDSVKDLKEKYPHVEVCACLGLLSGDQGDLLKKAGVKAYNHNINTSQGHYEKICGTHTYQDRLDTVQRAQESGLSSCSGVLAGMGETKEDLLETAFTLRDRKVESIPINFLISIDRTPLQNTHHLTPQTCLRILALFRFVNPSVEIRIAGGRELNLGSLQPLGLMMANSIFIGDYLTTKGQSAQVDLQMIHDLGYRVLGQPDDFLEKILNRPTPEIKSKAPVPA